uniref:Tubulin-specific chaperone D n=2 Tax=Arion vulgaris TaxID=1028688 RepID=A0A0B6ZXV7_9EUPU
MSVFIANFKNYTHGVIDHLSDVKIAHWDSTIRELSAKALHRLTACDPEYMVTTVLPKLLPMTTGLDLFLRHGAILSIAEILHALYPIAQSDGLSLEKLLSSETIEGIQSISCTLQDAKMFKRHGGEFMRKSVCSLIEKCSLSKMPFHNKPVIDLWQSVIDECLTHVEPEIQMAAVSAIPPFFSEYYTKPDGSVIEEKQDLIVSSYLHELKSSNQATRQGHSLALGSFPKSMLQGNLSKVMSGLITVSTITEKDEKMAEARRDAVKALSCICTTVNVQTDGDPDSIVCKDNVNIIYGALLQAMEDYTLDSRGDIGAWVREAAMQALHDISILVVKADSSLLSPSICKQIFCCLVQQAVEKIDRTRCLAGIIFTKLLYYKPAIPYIPHEVEVKAILPESAVFNTNFSAESDTYPLFSKLLALPEYTYNVLLGLVVSVGGITESIVKFSSASLQEYLKNLSKNRQSLIEFFEVLLTIFKDHRKDDRVSLPVMKTLDHVLSWGLLDSIASDCSDSVPDQIAYIIKTELHKCSKPQKIMAGADVYCGLLQFEGSPRFKSLTQLMILLCHKYPRVRKTTADKLYEALLTYDDAVPEENSAEVMTILSDTSWDTQEMAEIREKRNTLCDLIGVKRPLLLKKT